MIVSKIPVIIFCGGKATRFNNGKPGPLKPLIKVNKIPIVERIMLLYKKKGFNNFILLSGYKHKELSDYFKSKKNVKVIFTGINSTTAERLFKIKHLLKNTFFLTYGDSLTNFNPLKAIKNKNKNNMIISVYKKKIDYGVLDISKKIVLNIYQKTKYININAGFYIFDEKILKFLKFNSKNLEGDVLSKFNSKYQLVPYFVTKWHPMDNLKDKKSLEKILIKDKKHF